MTLAMPVFIVAVLSTLLLQAPAAGKLTLQGRVVKVGTSEGVAHARIVVAKVGGQVSDYRAGIADDGGRFAFRDLTAGTYRIYAEREDYLQAEHGQRPGSASGVPVALAEGNIAPEVVLSLTALGVVTGRVMDGAKPARDVWVRLLRGNYRNGQRSLDMVDNAQTDDRGEYRIFGITPGPYFISATPARQPRIEDDTYVVSAIARNSNNNQSTIRTPGAAVLAAGTLDPSAFDADIFIPVFYPSTTDPDAAAPIEVRAGATTTGIDLQIARASGVHVRGRVINGVTGQLAEDVTVSLSGGRSPVMPSQSSVFALAAVPPGEYRLVAQNTMFQNRMFASMPLTVADKDIDGLTITLKPGMTVRGRVRVEGQLPTGTSAPMTQFQLLGRSGNPSYGATPVQADGTFAINSVYAGEYGFRLLRGGTSFFVKSAQYGTEDVLTSSIQLRDNGADRIIDVVLSLNTAIVDVQVVDDAQRPVPGISVMAVPDAARRNRSEFFKSGTTDANGRVRIEGFAPGEYKLFASPVVDVRSLEDPDVIRRYEPRSTSVRLQESARQDVSLRVLP
jgi:hypothetical protein